MSAAAIAVFDSVADLLELHRRVVCFVTRRGTPLSHRITEALASNFVFQAAQSARKAAAKTTDGPAAVGLLATAVREELRLAYGAGEAAEFSTAKAGTPLGASPEFAPKVVKLLRRSASSSSDSEARSDRPRKTIAKH